VALRKRPHLSDSEGLGAGGEVKTFRFAKRPERGAFFMRFFFARTVKAACAPARGHRVYSACSLRACKPSVRAFAGAWRAVYTCRPAQFPTIIRPRLNNARNACLPCAPAAGRSPPVSRQCSPCRTFFPQNLQNFSQIFEFNTSKMACFHLYKVANVKCLGVLQNTHGIGIVLRDCRRNHFAEI
jgi:hypothetical protein